eukprot:GHVT01032288.1.p1 GENE.GHVT01032288.1~~GHVT01032288.1.p1  ORF type:complete len:167 (-),score=5.26 GHVT01032288.1:598-1098(-)
MRRLAPFLAGHGMHAFGTASVGVRPACVRFPPPVAVRTISCQLSGSWANKTVVKSNLRRVVVSHAKGDRLSRSLLQENGSRSFATAVNAKSCTEYNPTIENAAVNPEPGVLIRTMRPVWALHIFLFCVAVIQTKRQLKGYYKDTEHLYTNGWDRFHYHPGKNSHYT